MSRLCYLLTIIFLVDLCTVSVMAGWSCGHENGQWVEWQSGYSAYVLEYRDGSHIKCSLERVHGKPYEPDQPCIEGKCHKLYYWDGNNWHDKGKEGYGCCKLDEVRA